MQFKIEPKIAKHIDNKSFQESSIYRGPKLDSAATRSNTQRLLRNQGNMFNALIELSRGLETINANFLNVKESQTLNKKTYPDCLTSYKADAKKISKTDVNIILAKLQAHLGLLASSVANVNMSSLQEGDLAQPMEDEHDALPAIKRFIAPDNKEQVFVAICLNQGVRECICQLAVHEKIAIEDRNHYINLLLAYENRSASDVHTAYLAIYQLEIIGQMLMSQQAVC
ncbi:Uncharacterised protein [Legionella beliardensis]|uniref:Uncharacterized protein n=1 Tax=Legionella beliardensis TaxID=91822 RepID=A0A378I2X9_9GAMM|nr:hypothetical protein [Legionella beliardensis]STX29343.1 Uncharacterised protein [Legionella beliardensis]